MILKVELKRDDGTILFQGTFDALERQEWGPGLGKHFTLSENTARYFGFVYHPIVLKVLSPMEKIDGEPIDTEK